MGNGKLAKIEVRMKKGDLDEFDQKWKNYGFKTRSQAIKALIKEFDNCANRSFAKPGARTNA